MKKRIFKSALAVLLVLSLAFCFASCATTKVADADDADGKIEGTDIKWDYDADTKTLTLDGTGEIPDFENAESVPWYDARHSVKELEISKGITAIGDYSFYYFPELKDADIPETVLTMGKCAFAFCTSLENIQLPDTLTFIGDGCFEACTALKAIYVPSSVTEIGARAFAHCSALEDAVVMAQISEIGEWTFMGCTSLGELCFNEASREITVAENAFENAKSNFENAEFTASTTGEATLTVKYVYENGDEAHEAHTETLKRGASYSVTSPEIDGYKASELTVGGIVYGDETLTVTYTAVESETEAETEAETEVSETEAESDSVGAGTVIAIVIFAVVIVAIVVLVIFMIRSDKKQANGSQNRVSSAKNSKNDKRKKK